jgi:aminoglycoside phosphotransferase (APT) family kinase protein
LEQTLQPELVAAIIEEQFPNVRPVRVKYLGEGYDSTAFGVNDNLVFRFPKRSEVEGQLVIETKMLPLLAEGSPIPIPSYSFHGVPSQLFPRHFAGYAKLPGVPGIELDPTQVEFSRLAPVLGGFLSFLHAFPINTATQLGVPEIASTVLIENARAKALSDLEVVRRVEVDVSEDKLRGFLELGVDADQRSPIAHALVHRDLAAEHILLDRATQQVTGIIDWSEISVADPAIDFAGIFHWGGEEFTNDVLSHYDREPDDGLLPRARFLAACKSIADLAFGLGTHRPEYIHAGLRALRLCLAH